MDIWRDSIIKALDENQQSIATNSNYRKAHEDLAKNLQYYNETFEPSIMVPICSRVFMKGNLVHTNEVLVSLGCNYFVKTSTKKAVDICKRRLSEANKTLKDLEKEAQLLNDRLGFLDGDTLNSDLREIVEPYDEEAEKAWRNARKDKVAKSRRKEMKELTEIDDKELMEKLQLLELQEEMESFTANDHIATDSKGAVQIVSSTKEESVEPREFQIRRRLAEIRQRKKTKCLTEEDVFKRLDELDEEEQLEHELDKYYEENSHLTRDESASNSSSEEENSTGDHDEPDDEILISKIRSNKNGKRVSFAEETEGKLESQTLSINFKHSETSPVVEKSENSIQSPSDIYKLFPQSNEDTVITKPIIKNCHKVKEEIHLPNKPEEEPPKVQALPVNVIGNVIEHENYTNSIIATTNSGRPISKFKKMRQMKK